MKWKNTNTPTRLRLAAAFTLLVGLVGSVSIYLTAADVSDSDLVNEFENSNMYRHDLELYGGKANLLANDFRQWFDGLWHGKTLAYTIAVIAVIVALAIFFVAHHMPAGTKAEVLPD